ncbi:fimbrial protein [Salmonella enterica subsp. enterica serovar Typhi str. STH2370]|nr:fimbrial protein [Salmonella enterica subsp. enterica serovar Typhi str. STH2370]
MSRSLMDKDSLFSVGIFREPILMTKQILELTGLQVGELPALKKR